jgi:erythromycin esterase-like protein
VLRGALSRSAPAASPPRAADEPPAFGKARTRALRSARLALAAAVAATLAAPPADAQESAAAPFVAWARAHAGRLAPPNAAGCDDLEPLRRAVAKARIVALGELIHDARELHLLRNHVARCLVTGFGVTAIALESGFADLAPLHDALLHPPASVVGLTRRRVSYGWGGLPEVQALTESLRAHNLGQPLERRVRLYGIDLTGADGSGSFSRARRSVDELLRYLGRLDAAAAPRLSERLEPLLSRFSEARYPSLPPAARDSLRALLDSAEVLARASPPGSAAAPSRARAWALRCAAAARQTMEYLELRTRLGPRPSASPEFWRLVQLRDSIMADNLLWVLRQQSGRGRVLLLAHNAHVFADAGPVTLRPALSPQPAMLGQRLRAALGDGYVVIGTEARALGYYLAEQDAPSTASLGALLGTLGRRWLLLDLRAAAEDSAVGMWLRQPQLLRHQWGYQRIRPAVAADLLIYVDSLSPTGGEVQ